VSENLLVIGIDQLQFNDVAVVIVRVCWTSDCVNYPGDGASKGKGARAAVVRAKEPDYA
jgi:hypothetical protein